jgi:hypothetical protein
LLVEPEGHVFELDGGWLGVDVAHGRGCAGLPPIMPGAASAPVPGGRYDAGMQPRTLVFVLFAVAASACGARTTVPATVPSPGQDAEAIRWVRDSAEFHAAFHQAYRDATGTSRPRPPVASRAHGPSSSTPTRPSSATWRTRSSAGARGSASRRRAGRRGCGAARPRRCRPRRSSSSACARWAAASRS